MNKDELILSLIEALGPAVEAIDRIRKTNPRLPDKILFSTPSDKAIKESVLRALEILNQEGI